MDESVTRLTSCWLGQTPTHNQPPVCTHRGTRTRYTTPVVAHSAHSAARSLFLPGCRGITGRSTTLRLGLRVLSCRVLRARRGVQAPTSLGRAGTIPTATARWKCRRSGCSTCSMAQRLRQHAESLRCAALSCCIQCASVPAGPRQHTMFHCASTSGLHSPSCTACSVRYDWRYAGASRRLELKAAKNHVCSCGLLRGLGCSGLLHAVCFLASCGFLPSSWNHGYDLDYGPTWPQGGLV